MSSTKDKRSAPNATSKGVDWTATPGGLWPVVIHSLMIIIVVVNAIL